MLQKMIASTDTESMSATEPKFAGTHLQFPTEENQRLFLHDCAEQFRGLPRSKIGQRALNDPSFISQVEAGRNIKIHTFESSMVWLDVY
jgi:hypothetical protein